MLGASIIMASTNSSWRLISVALSLGCIAATLLYVTRLLRQRGLSSGGNRMKLVERLALEPRRSIYLVEVDGKSMLVGTSERGVELLPWDGATTWVARGVDEARP